MLKLAHRPLNPRMGHAARPNELDAIGVRGRHRSRQLWGARATARLSRCAPASAIGDSAWAPNRETLLGVGLDAAAHDALGGGPGAAGAGLFGYAHLVERLDVGGDLDQGVAIAQAIGPQQA